MDKPAGVAVIPGRSQEGGPALRVRLEAQLGRPLWVVHRLDRDTSGRPPLRPGRGHPPGGEPRVRAWAARQAVPRARLPAARGRPPGSTRRWCPPAARGCGSPVPGEAGKAAVTELAPVETFGDVALVEARPLTGRTHQIRVHLRHVGAPLLVDPQYGRPDPVTERTLGGVTDAVVLDRTPLHAARLVLPAADGPPGGGRPRSAPGGHGAGGGAAPSADVEGQRRPGVTRPGPRPRAGN